MRIQLATKSTPPGITWSRCAMALLSGLLLTKPLLAQEVDWSNYGNDLANSRYANLDQITPANVSQLKTAWVFHTGLLSDPSMSMEMTPIIIDGVMYVTSGDDDVFALNPTTGKQIWAYHPTDMVKISTLPVCCNNDNRGVAYGNGLIFNARLDANLVALNAKTGAVVWKTQVDLPSNGAGMTLAPLYIAANNGAQPEVIVGVTGGEFAARGHLDAYNPTTGKLLWRFWTTEPATWAGTSWQHGGATVWGTPTFDPTLNMIYFSTGNAYPWPYAAPRAGANLYAASIVAVDATAGTLQWFFQEAHHEMWDYDGPQPTILFSLNGVPALEHTNKTGYVWILDRASGEPLFPYQEVAVPPTPANALFQAPWPTQPVSSIESLAQHKVEAYTLAPGEIAAPMWATVGPTEQVFVGTTVEWPPAAYSPRTQMIYSHAQYRPTNRGVTPAGVSQSGAPVLGVNSGVFGAINTQTGKVAWTIPMLTESPYSGMTVAGDLVFFGDSTGLFYAANAMTGEILWVFDVWTEPNATGGNASAAIYEAGGVEYVVYGFGGEPGKSYALGDAVIAFALPPAIAASKEAATLTRGTLVERGRVK